MKINNKNELKLFKAALDKCRHSLLLTTNKGKTYDLRTPDGLIKGMEELQKKMKPFQEPELFVTNPDDVRHFVEFFTACPEAV